MNPDESTLEIWLDDALSPQDQIAIDAWVQQHQPELLQQRADFRKMKQMLATALPTEITPPLPDRFNQEIMQRIKNESEISKKPIYLRLIAPLGIAAAIVLAFVSGMKLSQPHTSASDANSYVYTPDNQIKAETITNKKSDTTVIVLNGMKAIPDSVDFSPHSAQQMPDKESENTASTQELILEDKPSIH